MPQVELTDKFCSSAKVISGRKTDYFDKTVKGLCLRTSSGGTKTWFVVYTTPSQRKRAWLKLGVYPDTPLGGLNGARQKARDARAKIGDGADPIAERRAYANSQTVGDMVENYILRRASTRRSCAEIARRLRKNVSNVIGDLRLADLHRRDLTRCIDAVKDRGAAVEANRVFEDVRAMVRWARGRGDLEANLTEGMAHPTEAVARDRWLAADEIRTVWTGLAEAEMRESTRRILRLCLLTAQRVGEVCGMTRDELDLEAATWTIPAGRTKNAREHVVPLSRQALSIIREQIADLASVCARRGIAAPDFVFSAPDGRAAIGGGSVAHALRRQAQRVDGGKSIRILGVAPFTPHDLRRTAATGMEQIGISPFVVGHVLNHISVTKASITSQVYARYDYAREKRDALQAWAERLDEIVHSNADLVAALQARL